MCASGGALSLSLSHELALPECKFHNFSRTSLSTPVALDQEESESSYQWGKTISRRVLLMDVMGCMVDRSSVLVYIYIVGENRMCHSEESAKCKICCTIFLYRIVVHI